MSGGEPPFWTFIAAMIPLGFIIGVSAGAVGCTGWFIVTPLMLVAYDFPLQDALLITMAVDCVDGLVIAAVYGYQNLVSWYVAIVFGLVASAVSVPVLIGSRAFVIAHEAFIKSSTPFGLMFFAAGFGIRAVVATWRKRQAKQAAVELDQDETVVEKGVKNNTNTAATPLIQADDGGDDGWSGVSAKLSDFTWQNWLLVAFLSGVVGVVAGLAGFGGGVLFVVVFVAFLKWDTWIATGTGGLMMFILMGALIGALGVCGGVDGVCSPSTQAACAVDIDVLGKYLLVALPPACVGTVVGALFARRLSKILLDAFISTFLFVVAFAAIIQAAVLKKENAK